MNILLLTRKQLYLIRPPPCQASQTWHPQGPPTSTQPPRATTFHTASMPHSRTHHTVVWWRGGSPKCSGTGGCRWVGGPCGCQAPSRLSLLRLQLSYFLRHAEGQHGAIGAASRQLAFKWSWFFLKRGDPQGLGDRGPCLLS